MTAISDAPVTRTGPHPLALPVVLAAVFMTILDVFIVNVAIPSMQSDLTASDSQIQWVVAGFGLAFGAAVITAGRLGDLVGRRRMFGVGLAAFTATSALCGLAPTAPLLVGFRVLQGLAAGVVTPQVLAIIGAAYVGKAHTRAITAYGLTLGLAAVFGQLIGGVLIQVADWRWCFLINVPIGLAALALTRRVVPAAPGTGRERLDLTGAVLATLAVTAAVLPLIDGRSQGWPEWTALSGLAAAALTVWFVVNQRRSARRGGEPLVDMGLFRSRRLSAGLAAQLVFSAGQISFFLVLAVDLQQGKGMTALASGGLFTVIGAGYLATSLVANAALARWGRQTVAVGAALMIVGLVLMHDASGSALALAPGLFVDGAGMGLVIAPLTSLVLTGVAPERIGAVSGVLSMVQQIGGALGVAVVGVVFYGRLDAGVDVAFRAACIVLIAVAAAVIIGTQFIPRRQEAR